MLLNILTMTVCLTLVLISYQINKQNSSLGKVKKFTDKVYADFDAYFKDQTQKTQNAGVELGVKQSQAVAAVKRLENNIELFDKHSDDLNQRMTVIDEMEKRTDQYDTQLKVLMEMTEKVDENLERIRVASKSFDKINHQIENHDVHLQKIETQIPQIIQKFTVENHKVMDVIGEEYKVFLEQSKESISELAENAVETYKNNVSD